VGSSHINPLTKLLPAAVLLLVLPFHPSQAAAMASSEDCAIFLQDLPDHVEVDPGIWNRFVHYADHWVPTWVGDTFEILSRRMQARKTHKLMDQFLNRINSKNPYEVEQALLSIDELLAELRKRKADIQDQRLVQLKAIEKGLAQPDARFQKLGLAAIQSIHDPTIIKYVHMYFDASPEEAQKNIKRLLKREPLLLSEGWRGFSDLLKAIPASLRGEFGSLSFDDPEATKRVEQAADYISEREADAIFAFVTHPAVVQNPALAGKLLRERIKRGSEKYDLNLMLRLTEFEKLQRAGLFLLKSYQRRNTRSSAANLAVVKILEQMENPTDFFYTLEYIYERNIHHFELAKYLTEYNRLIKVGLEDGSLARPTSWKERARYLGLLIASYESRRPANPRLQMITEQNLALTLQLRIQQLQNAMNEEEDSTLLGQEARTAAEIAKVATVHFEHIGQTGLSAFFRDKTAYYEDVARASENGYSPPLQSGNGPGSRGSTPVSADAAQENASDVLRLYNSGESPRPGGNVSRGSALFTRRLRLARLFFGYLTADQVKVLWEMPDFDGRVDPEYQRLRFLLKAFDDSQARSLIDFGEIH